MLLKSSLVKRQLYLERTLPFPAGGREGRLSVPLDPPPGSGGGGGGPPDAGGNGGGGGAGISVAVRGEVKEK